jgi:hypothetical protein
VLRQGSVIFRQQDRLRYFLAYIILQTIFVPFFGLAGLLIPYRWKGDWYRTARMPRTLKRGMIRVRKFMRAKRHAGSPIS